MIMPDSNFAWTRDDNELVNDLALAVMEIAQQHQVRIVEVLGALEFAKSRLQRAAEPQE